MSDNVRARSYPGLVRDYDFFISSDDQEWELKISKKLEKRGHRAFHRKKFIPGSLKLTSRLQGVQECKVVIIGFLSPPKQKTDIQLYTAALAAEYWKVEDRVVCIQVTEDAVIPEELSAFHSVEYQPDEEALCNELFNVIDSVKSGTKPEREAPIGADEPDFGARQSRTDSGNSPDTTVKKSKTVIIAAIIFGILGIFAYIFYDVNQSLYSQFLIYLDELSGLQILSILFLMIIVIGSVVFGIQPVIKAITLIRTLYDILKNIF